MKSLTLTLVLFAFPAFYSFGQDSPSKFLKIGAFPHQFYGSDGYSLHLEFENSFIRRPSLSHGIGIDYIYEHQNNKYSILRYNLKYYPFQSMFNQPCSGFYFGLSPNVFYQDRGWTENRYAFGVMPFMGFQYVINGKYSISGDINMNMTSDPDKESNVGVYYSPMFFSIKFGINISGN